MAQVNPKPFDSASAGAVLPERSNTSLHSEERTEWDTSAPNEARLRLVIDAIPGLVCYIDSALRYRLANKAYAEWFGLQASELDGRTIQEVVGLSAFEDLRTHLDQAFKGEIVSFEESVLYKNCKQRHIRATYVPDRTASGVVQGLIVLIADISEEKKMREANLHLAAIVQGSDDAIISKDLNGIITSWNSAAELLFGYSATEAIGMPVANLAVPDRANEMPDILSRIRRGERIDHYETFRRTKDGQPVAVSLTVSPILDPSGRVIGASKILRDISERNRMQGALQAREQESRSLLASLPDIIARFDRHRRSLYISPALKSQTGLPASEMLGKTLGESSLPPQLSQKLDSWIGGVISSRATQAVEFDIASPTGSTRRYHGIGVPEFSGLDVHTVLAIMRDVTEQEEAKEAQQELEHELLLLIEASGTLLASLESAEVLRTIVNLAQRFVKADAYAVWRANTVNGQWSLSSFSGLSTSFATQGSSGGPPLSEKPIVVEDVDREPILTERAAVLRAEGIRSILIIPLKIHREVSGTVVFYWRTPHRFSLKETRISAALGNLAASALGTAELYDRQSHLRGIAEASQKRTEFLAEAGALLSSSLVYEKTLAAVAKLAVPIFADWCSVDLVDSRGEIKRVAVEHVDPEKIRFAYKLMNRYPPGDADASRIAIRTGRSQLVEEITDNLIDKRARDPEHAELIRGLGLRSFILAPMLMGERVLGLITFATAESNRQYHRADLSLAEELARRSAVAIENSRLYEETERQGHALRLSNADLRRANADLEQFAYSASHDLKEPLRMVSLFTQLLEKKYLKQLDREAQEYIAEAVQGAQRMEMLVRDLLAYTTASASEKEPVEFVDANDILEQTLGILHSDLATSGAEVSHTELPPVRIHAVQLHQLFQNLIGNAIKYRSEDAPRIHISAQPKDAFWLFAIQDNGIGISSEYAEQIFGLFKRLHGRNDYEGTGLGLAICKKIVESLGGRIWVRPNEGRGSTFSFTIPRPDE